MLMTPFYGELLILILIVIICSRVFLTEHTKIDSIVLFAPLAFALSVLQIVSWGLNIAEVILFYFSFFVFFINWRGLIRFCNRLYIDTYSPLFITSSSICLIAAVLLGVLFSLYAPLRLNPQNYSVAVEQTFFTEISGGEYIEATDISQKKNVKLTVYSPDRKKTKLDKDDVILFIPDKRTAPLAYDPYLILLAKYGYTIYKADFGFSKVPRDVKRMIPVLEQQRMIKKSLKNPGAFDKDYAPYENVYAEEFEILSRIADKKEAHIKRFVIAGDGLVEKSFGKIKNPARPIHHSFPLSSVSEYKTNGFGFIQQTNPMTAKLHFDLERDKTFFAPSYSALKTKDSIEAHK